MTPTKTVFLVEDEVMIRMMVADMLEELGYQIAAEAGQIDQALQLAQTTQFDFAILDINVDGKVITPVADLLTRQKRPFIFASGYDSSGLPQSYSGHHALQKPFTASSLSAMIDKILP
jgi:CheY-like chemotaxis protein